MINLTMLNLSATGRSKAKLAFEMLDKEFQSLTENEQVNIKGGGDPIFVTGSYLEENGLGVEYHGNDGSFVFFPGVELSTFAANGTGYQFNGTIHLSSSGNWDVEKFAYEYGHYLQEQEMGTLKYLFTIGMPSLMSAAFDA